MNQVRFTSVVLANDAVSPRTKWNVQAFKVAEVSNQQSADVHGNPSGARASLPRFSIQPTSAFFTIGIRLVGVIGSLSAPAASRKHCRRSPCPDIAPDSEAQEHWRLEAPARFDGIHGYDVVGHVIASSIWHGRSTALPL
jgi:hypothetical protein